MAKIISRDRFFSKLGKYTQAEQDFADEYGESEKAIREKIEAYRNMARSAEQAVFNNAQERKLDEASNINQAQLNIENSTPRNSMEEEIAYAKEKVGSLSTEEQSWLDKLNTYVRDRDAITMNVALAGGDPLSQVMAQQAIEGEKEQAESAKKNLEKTGKDYSKYSQYINEIKDAEEREKEKKDIKESLNTGDSKKDALNAALYTAYDIALSPIAGGAAMLENLNRRNYADQNAPLNTNSSLYMMQNLSSDIEEGVSNRIDNKVGQFAYGVGVSTGKAGLSMAMAGGVVGELGLTGKAANAVADLVTLPQFGSSAYATTLQNAQERGLSHEQAQQLAVTSGAAEMIFEKVSLDHFWDIAKNSGKAATRNALVNVLAQSGIEGSEEVFTSIANEIADNLISKDKSEYNSSVKAYQDEGYSEDEAKKKAKMDFLVNLGIDFAGGAISGGIFGAVGSVGSSINVHNNANRAYGVSDNGKEKYTGKEVAEKYAQVRDLFPEEGNTPGQTNVANQFKQDADLYRIKAQNDMDVSQSARNDLYRKQSYLEEQYETDDKYRQIVDEYRAQKSQENSAVASEMVNNTLKTLNQAPNIEEAPGTIVEEKTVSANLEELNNSNLADSETSEEKPVSTSLEELDNSIFDEVEIPSEMRQSNNISADEALENIGRSTNAEELTKAYNDAKNSENISEKDMEVVDKQLNLKKNVLNVELNPTTEDAYAAGVRGEEFTPSNAEEERAYNQGEIYRENRVQSEKNPKTATIIADNGDRFTMDSIRMEDGEPIVTSTDGKEYNLGDVRFAHSNAQDVVNNSLQYNNPQAYLDGYNPYFGAERYEDAIKNVYNYARLTGPQGTLEKAIKTAKGLKIDNNTLETFYNEGLNEFVPEKPTKRTSVKKAEGKVIDKDKRLSKSQTKALKAVAKAMKLDVVVSSEGMETKDGHIINGFFSEKDNQITLNPNAKDIYKTLIHEAFGELSEVYAPEEMDELQAAIIEYNLEKRPSDFNKTVDSYHQVYVNHEGSKSYREAANEYVNDLLVELFADEEGVKEFANFISDRPKSVMDRFIDLIDSIIDGFKKLMGANHDMFKNDVESLKRLRKMALDTFETARKNKSDMTSEQSEATSVEVKNSIDVDSTGKELTEGQKKFFKNTKAVDEDGDLQRVFHGTLSEFYEFDKEKANPEGNLGKGFYFTNVDYDAENNYADRNGPDFTNKVEREAELLEDDERYSDMEHDEIVEMLKDKYATDPMVLEGYLNIQNPVYINKEGKGDTYLFDFEDELPNYDDFEDEDEYYQEVEDIVGDKVYEALDAVKDYLGDDYYESEMETLSEIIGTAAMEGGITYEQLRSRLNDANAFFETEDGIAQSEVLRIIAESLGYDGIIDSSVSNKFTAMNMPSDTTHYVVFDSNQFKLADNENPTDNPDIRYSVEVDSEGNKLTKDQQRYFADSKAVDNHGRLMVMYHGTERADFTVFDSGYADDGISLFFTDNEDVAKSYSGTKDNVKFNYTLEDLNEMVDGYEDIVKEGDTYKLREYIPAKDDYKTIFEGTFDEMKDYVVDMYGTVGSGNYKVYINAVNPYEVDVNGNFWNDINANKFTMDDDVWEKNSIYLYDFDGETYELRYDQKPVDLHGEGKEVKKRVTPDELRTDVGDYIANYLLEMDEAINHGELHGKSIHGESGLYKGGPDGEWIPNTTRQYAAYAKENGYDSVIFRNIVDNGLYADSDVKFDSSNIIIAFNSNQVKSVENEHPTENEDIRYSLDVDYQKAYEENDVKTMQRLVDIAAKEAGYDSPKLYHGTESFGRTQLHDFRGIFTTTLPNIARTYSYSNTPITELGDVRRHRTNNIDLVPDDKLLDFINYHKEDIGNLPFEVVKYDGKSKYITDNFFGKKGKMEAWELRSYIRRRLNQNGVKEKYSGVYSFYGKTDNALVIDAKGKAWNEFTAVKVRNALNLSTDEVPNGKKYTTDEIVDLAKANGYRQVIIKNIYDVTYGLKESESKLGTDYIFLYPSTDVKSADPITYDDEGNIIPLSERFNNKENDIRYSIDVGDIEQEAKEHFGTTENFRIAGYMLKDGTMLDFSGVHWLDENEREKNRASMDIRQVDHEDITEVYDDDEAYEKFIDERGNIRMMPESPGVTVPRDIEPTPAQYRQLKEFIREAKSNPKFNNYDFYVDIGATNPKKLAYRNNINEDRIVNDLKKYYSTGEVAKESLNDFRYSIDVLKDKAKRYDIDYDLLDVLDNPTYDMVTDDTMSQILDSVNELFRGQNVDEATIQNVAKDIKEYADSNIKQSFLEQELKSLFTWMQNASGVDAHETFNMFKVVAKEIVDEAKTESIDDEFRKYVKGMRISLSDNQKNEVANTFGSYDAFRKAYFGTLTLANDGAPLDSVWSEIVEQSGGGLRLDVSDADQPLMLADYLDALKPQPVNNYGANKEEVATDLAIRILEKYYAAEQQALTNSEKEKALKESNPEIKQTIERARADMRKAEIEYRKQVKAEYDAREAELIKELSGAESVARMYNRQYRDLQNKVDAGAITSKEDKEEIKKLKDTLSRKEKALAKAQAKAKAPLTAYQEQLGRKEEKRKITQLSNRLMKMVYAPTEKLHMPEEFREPIGEFLNGIDFITHRGDINSIDKVRWQTRMDNLRHYLSELSSKESATQNELNLAELLEDELLEDMEKFTRDHAEDKKISRMSKEDLHILYGILTRLSATVSKTNETFANSRYTDMAKLNRDSLDEMKELSDPKVNSGLLKSIKDFFGKDLEDPITYFSLLGDAPKSLFDGFLKGFDIRTGYIKDAQEYTKSFLPENVYKWEKDSHTFNVKEGELKLSTAQIMTLYETVKRKNAKLHNRKGGIKAKNYDLLGKVTISPKAAHLTDSEYKEIFGVLTPEQIEIADKLQWFMANPCAEWGNKVSMKAWGYKKFTEKDYFPMQVAPDSRVASNKDLNTKNLYANKNMSASKELKEMASNPLVIDSIFNVFTEHVADMATYGGMVLPQMDAMRWFNYKVTEVDSQDRAYYDGTQQELGRLYGLAGTKYFLDLIAGINGAEPKARGINMQNAVIGHYKKVAVMAKIRVAIQQPTAFVRAYDEMDGKYLTKALATTNPAKYSKIAKENSMLAWWKGQGYYESYIGKGLKEMIVGKNPVVQKVEDIQGWGAQTMDDLTWGILYHASELEIKDKHPDLKGKEFTDAVVERFEDLVSKTQVVDTMLHRSDIMRRQDSLTKVATSFMTEPLKTYNMLLRSFVGVGRDRNKKTVQKLIRTLFVFVLNNAILSAVTTAWDAFRKDDDETPYSERFLSMYPDEFLDNTNPVNMLPFVKDVIDAVADVVEGNYFAKTDMSTDAFRKAATFGSHLYKTVHGEKVSVTPYGLVKEGAQAISYLVGIPAINVWNDIEGIHNGFFDNWETKKQSSYNKFYKAIDNGDDLTQIIEELHEEGKEDKAIKSQITSHYKQTYLDTTDMTEKANLKNALIKAYMAAGDSRAEAIKKINKW